jgi:glycosyltransferase involved in cell wall biosynthesis
LTEALSARGHTVGLVTFSEADSDVHKLSASVQRISLAREKPSKTFAQRLWNSADRVQALTSALRRFRPEAIVSFTDITNVHTLLANQFLRLPIVVSERVDPRFHSIDRINARLRLALYGSADALVVQTESIRAWANSLPRQPPTYIIPNPVLPAEPSSDSEPVSFRPYVLGIGRLAAQKGFDTLIPAFARLRATSPNLRLVLLGEGPERNALMAQCASLGLSDSVSLLGFRPTAPWLRDAHMFVLSSRYEGFPNALGEAMAAGLPIVSTRCPSGPEEMLTNNHDGLLVDVGDIHALSTAMSRLNDDLNLRAQLGSAARATVEARYAPNLIWDSWERVIGEAMAHRTRPQRPAGR